MNSSGIYSSDTSKNKYFVSNRVDDERNSSVNISSNYKFPLFCKYPSDTEVYNTLTITTRENNVHSSPFSKDSVSDSEITNISETFSKRKYNIAESETSTSADSSSYDSLYMSAKDDSNHFQGYFSCTIVILLGIGLIFTPILFLILPKILLELPHCETCCQIQCALLVFKTTIFAISSSFLFIRRSSNTFPRLQLKSLFFSFILIAFIIGNWVFFLVGVIYLRLLNYDQLLEYMHLFVECAFFIMLMEIIFDILIPIKAEYYLEVVRNTDGERRFYAVGQLTLQETAAWILEEYYIDFTEYNPYLHMLHFHRTKKTAKNVEMHDIYRLNQMSLAYRREVARTVLSAVFKNSKDTYDGIVKEQDEHELKIRNRRAKLIFITEEAFSYIEQLSEDAKRLGKPIDVSEMTSIIFPSMAPSFYEYLESTRKLHFYNLDSIKEHLSQCIALHLSPRALLARYLNTWPVITHTHLNRAQ